MGGGGLQFLAPILESAGDNPFSVLWYAFLHGGFVVLLPLFVKMLWDLWMVWIQTTWGLRLRPVLLGINVPPLNEQSMVAIEQVFAHISGPHQNYTWLEIHWDGACQYTWSLELASIDGYVQYMIRTDKKMRDVVEAAIYAQYPDAEIFEVEDYATKIPRVWPADGWVLWGVELAKTNEHVYPIRTYRAFEHPLTGIYADPMAAMLEIFGNLGPGEQLWFQIVMTPTDHHWPKRAEKIIAKIVGAKAAYKPTAVDRITDVPLSAMNLLSTSILGAAVGGTEEKDQGPPNKMLYLTPPERAILDAISLKITKIAFFCKIRFIYAAKEEVARRKTIVSSMFGAIKQYNTLDMNGFKPGQRTKTTAEWLFADQRKNWRKTKIARAYRERDNAAGEGEGVLLNIEEIASLWHFPILTVKAPALGKAQARKGEPPVELPVERVVLPSGETAFRVAGSAAPSGTTGTVPSPTAAAASQKPQHPILPKGFKARPASRPGIQLPRSTQPTIQPTTPLASEAHVQTTPAPVFDPTFSQARQASTNQAEPEELPPEEGPGAPPPNLPFV